MFFLPNALRLTQLKYARPLCLGVADQGVSRKLCVGGGGGECSRLLIVYMLMEYGRIRVIDYGTRKAFIRKIKAIE